MTIEQQVRDAWAASDRSIPEPTVTFFEQLLAEDPSDPTRLFELASAYEWTGREDDAIPLYERALDAGLDADRDRRARVQYGSSLRNVGRFAEAVEALEQARRRYPSSAAVNCFLALALVDGGNPRAAVSHALRAAVTGPATDLDEYRVALTRYADDVDNDPSPRGTDNAEL